MNPRTDQFPTVAAPPVLQPASDEPSASISTTIPATRARLRMKQSFKQNRFVLIGAGALVIAFLLFVAVSVPHNKSPRKTTPALDTQRAEIRSDDAHTEERSLLPITNVGPLKPTILENGAVNEEAVEHTATRVSVPAKPARPSPAIHQQPLASVPPFPEPWQPPPYSRQSESNQEAEQKSDRDALQKSSIAYMRNAAAPATNTSPQRLPVDREVMRSLGLPQGTRLRAHLESAVSTGLRAPVIAVVEYNYERGGEIIVPAGAKAIGHIQQADRSGYMSIEFDTLLMPDDSSVPIQAVATDLNLGPPKGKVEGRNAGKNLLLRSLSGIGQAGALLVGHGSLDQPLSESDMLRERVSNNIGQASDEQVSRLALSEHLVVTIPAATSVYIILEKKAESENATTTDPKASSPSNFSNLDDLRQLLQLQRELQQRQ